MKRFSGIISVLLFLSAAFFSCTKEEIPCCTNALPPGSAEVNTVSCSGGNPAGRWSVTFVQALHYRNDTLISTDTASYLAGAQVVNFSLSGRLQLWEFSTLVDTGYYHADAGLLSYSLASGNSSYSFGVSPSGKMRWRNVDTYTVGKEVYRTETNMIFERY